MARDASANAHTLLVDDRAEVVLQTAAHGVVERDRERRAGRLRRRHATLVRALHLHVAGDRIHALQARRQGILHGDYGAGLSGASGERQLQRPSGGRHGLRRGGLRAQTSGEGDRQ